MNIRPLGDRILVKRIQEEEKTKGGSLFQTPPRKPQEGKVVAVGKGKMTENGKLLPPDVKAGDRILFGKYAGSEIKLEGEEPPKLRNDMSSIMRCRSRLMHSSVMGYSCLNRGC